MGETELVFVVGTGEEDTLEGVTTLVRPVVEKLAGRYGFACRANKPTRGCVEVDLTARPGQELSNAEMYTVVAVAILLLILVQLFITYFRN